MAANAPLHVINLGTQTVSMARFLPAPNGGLILDAYAASEVIGDPGADASRISQLRIAVGEVASKLGLKGGNVVYAIPGQSIFARIVKLPSVGEEKVEQIVQFEAHQNVPFPINEVVWDYQIVSDANATQMEVVLVAVKADLLDDLNETITANGLKTQIVDVAPAALYNAFRYNYSDLGGCSLLIDLGSRTTNLIFVEPGKLFTRGINVGGSTITAAIAKEFEESFNEAEKRKRETGFVSLGGAYAEPPDPDVSRTSKLVRNTMTRIHAEISRSIGFYKSQQGGSQPQRVFLCGGGSNLPYMREFFQEKLQIPIEFLNPLRNVAVSKRFDIENAAKDAHLYGEIVGLALRPDNSCPLELNLRPASVVRQQAAASQKPYLIAAGLALLLGLGAWWMHLDRGATVKTEVLQSVNEKVAELAEFEQKFNNIKNENKALEDRAAQLMQTQTDRDFWVRIIDDLNVRLPEKNIWITGLQPLVGDAPLELGGTQNVGGSIAPVGEGATGQPTQAESPKITGVRLTGLYLDNPAGDRVVYDFAKNLEKSPFYKFNFATEQKAILPKIESQNDRDWAFAFEMKLPLVAPLALP